MGTVVSLQERQPHFCLPGVDGAEHVFPASLPRDVVAGRLPTEALGDDLIRAIVADWLTGWE